MSAPTNDHPTHDHTTHEPLTTLPVPPAAARVEAALTRLDHDPRLSGPIPTTDAGWVAYSTVRAVISARRAGWWRVLLADDARTRAMHPSHARAAAIAHHRARADARFWRDTAADWHARAEQRPTSDAAGSVSNWDRLGVTG